MWNKVGMSRNVKGLTEAISEIKELREQFWKEVKVPGTNEEYERRISKSRSCCRFLELRRIVC